MPKTKQSLQYPWFWIIFSVPVLIAFWEGICRLGNVPEFILPTPSRIAKAAAMLSGELPSQIGITLFESVSGFLFGAIGGIAFGTACSFSRKLEVVMLPYAIAVKTIPIIALAPLLTIWFGTSIISKIILVVLMCFFPVLINTLRGLQSIPPEQLDLFRCFAATEWQIFCWLRCPNALPSVFSGLRVSAVFAVVGAVVAEFAGAEAGIGFRILITSYQLEVPDLFVYIIASALLGIGGYAIVCLAERILIPWYRDDEF